MARLTLPQLEARCQKLEHRRLGNWLARRVARPAALRVTWLIAPWGISAHAATLAAWGIGLCACAAFAQGTIAGWLMGSVLLPLWYLLDHVDGQLARLRGQASLDGVQLDYLMHHTLNLLLPVGLGWGLAALHVEPLWLLAGGACGLCLLLAGLLHDTRYKAFVQRLKLVRGELRLLGGGGGRPTPPMPPPRTASRLAMWLTRKACEPHVMLAVLVPLSVAQGIMGDTTLLAGRCYLLLMTLLAALLAGITLIRSVQHQAAEQEFAAWFQPPPGCELHYADGWWHVVAAGGSCRAVSDRE
ncbi:MAG: CDP-alcohol phosphatidyltransferase family protein [Pirellulales bacterium]